MRFSLAALITCCVLAAPVRSSAQTTAIDGFGAFSISQPSSLTGSGMPVDFGGRVSVDLFPGLQAIGEFGRLGNVLPEIYSLPLSFAPGDVRLSAFYGEGGIRLLAAPRSGVTPYVEGTAGLAHLQLGFSGLNPTADALARAALGLVDSRDPIIGGGGGVLMRAGALQMDIGYRYKRILADSLIGNVLSFGQKLDTHQVRFGVGVRF